MSAQVRFQFNTEAVRSLGRMPGVVQHTGAVAEALRADTADNTPRNRGVLARSWEASAPAVDADGAVAYVSSTHPGAVAAEVGSVNNPPYAMATQAVASSGMRYAGRF